MNLNVRAQHGLLAVAVAAALATGLLLGRPVAGGGASARVWHLFAGVGSLVLLAYHVLYLAVRGYVEGRRWSGYELRLRREDFAAAAAELGHLLGGAPERPAADEYRVTQKLLYWWTQGALALLGATGVGMAAWARLGTLALLPQLAAVHRGLAVLLLVTVLWHLYGALTGEGRWWPEASWLTGALAGDKAARKLPGAWRRHLLALESEGLQVTASAEEKQRERQTREKDDVQAELEKGNAFALEERYVEALFHYRRALELYPGYSQARYNMARVLARMGERDMARETFRQFLEMDPFHPLAQRAQEAMRELEKEQGRP
jgi:cytochrome b subunit of formate dehydrogenase